ncbi:MAG: MMPL family transporter [Acidimicrobiales bacterium]|nr:MMPL family transporter [Acidimicrobiales bacterium]
MTPPQSAIAAWVARRPWTVLGVAAAVSVVLGLGVPRLDFETSQEGLIGEDHPISVQNTEFQRHFGGEAMIAVITAHEGRRIDDLVAPGNRDQLRQLEDGLRDTGMFHSVIGPVTGLEFGLRQFSIAQDMIAAARERTARDATPARLAEVEAMLDARVDGSAARAATALEEGAGLDDPVSLDNPAMVAFLLYEDETETSTRPVLRDAFPDSRHALLVARLPGNLPLDDTNDAIDAFEAAVADVELDGFDVFATGSPELIRDINDYLQSGLVTLGLLAVLVMVVVLAGVFRVRWRLLSMAVVLIGAVWGFGLMGYVGVPLTLITISGLPILIGVGVDFSIQIHSRFEEELAVDGSTAGAVRRVFARLVPTLGIAMLAAVAGFLSLQISDVPQIRQFGLMLALGIAALLVTATLVPLAVLVLRERHRPTGVAAASGSGAIERMVRWMCFALRRRLVPVVAVGAVVVVAGLAVEGRFTIQTDPERWVPQDSSTVDELGRLRQISGFSSELVVLVEAPDVTSTEVLGWVQRFADAQVERHPEVLVRGASLAGIVAEVTGAPPGQDEALVMLGGALDDPPTYDVAPADVVQSFVSADRGRAAVVFPIRPITLQERRALLEEMRADLDPPAGTTAAVGQLAPPEGTSGVPTGLAAIGAEFVELLEANRVEMTWLALGAVALCLLLAYRSVTMTVLPLVPVTIAVGLSSLVTLVSGRELSPLTSVTGPLVIATCTEFSVLILARYVEERRRGRDPAAAVEVGAVRIGRAFLASGLTSVGGFAVLGLSSYPLLRDFGILVALNVIVALVSALAVLPPLLMWADADVRLTRFPPGALDAAVAEAPPDGRSPGELADPA